MGLTRVSGDILQTPLNVGVVTATEIKVGTGVTISAGIVSATSFSGDGSQLTGISAGATLSSASGTQRVVLTGQTSGLMTATATDSDLTFNAVTNTLNLVNLYSTGIATSVNFSEVVNVVGNTGAAATINLNNGTFVTATLTDNCTFTFSNPGNSATSFTLLLTNDATPSRTITWPPSVKWPNAVVPTRTETANKTDVYTFFTYDSGTTWWGSLSLYNYS
jgi:hypothetical protein